MFPIRDDNPHFLTPVVTYGLIAANVLAWLLLQGAGTEPVSVELGVSARLDPRRIAAERRSVRAFRSGPTRCASSVTRARGSHR